MCKDCQTCIESCYWHIIEKRFCYDENIALYEDPIKTAPQHNGSFENMAYFDQVSIIAGRAIVTIDSLPVKPIESQPKPRLRWWEDSVDFENKKNEARNQIINGNVKSIEIPQRTIPTINEEHTENLSRSMEALDKIISEKVENQNTAMLTPNLTTDDNLVILRKKSLHERRMSRSLTLAIIDRPMELPIIRQQSMPKFYIDTPEPNQTDCSILNAPSATLTSPVMPRDDYFDFFDLKSVVNLEREMRSSASNQQIVPVHRHFTAHSRLMSIKEKLRPINKLKRHSSLNLPNSINHM